MEPEAKKEWMRLTKKIDVIGILTDINAMAFAWAADAARLFYVTHRVI